MFYNKIKKTIYALFPKAKIKKNKTFLRKIYALLYLGNNCECTICSKKIRKFIKINNKLDDLCPHCGSISRDRRLFLLLLEELRKRKTTTPKVLDFSPSDGIYYQLSKMKNIHYYASDLSGDFNATYQYDLTNIECEENQFDIIICFHVLEHIIDDQKAISELYRVLKPNGVVFIQTPFKEGEIYEDFSIISEEERIRHFGQNDHVRIYSVIGLEQRLSSVGFNNTILNFDHDDYHGFKKGETIIIASKMQ